MNTTSLAYKCFISELSCLSDGLVLLDRSCRTPQRRSTNVNIDELYQKRERIATSFFSNQDEYQRIQEELNAAIERVLVDAHLITIDELQAFRSYGKTRIEEICHNAISLYLYCLRIGDPWFEAIDDVGGEPRYEKSLGKL